MLPALLAVTFTAAPGWQAGFAAVPITPDRPQWMAGYAARTAPAEGKDTELYAKAAVLVPPGQPPLVLVTLDLVGIDRETSQRIVNHLRDRMNGLPRERIAVAVSHTHCGPVVGTTLRSMYFLKDDQAELVRTYTLALPDKVLAAVTKAVENAKPVTLSHGSGLCRFAVNRRENKEADVPKKRDAGEGLNGPVDHAVPVLAARDGANKLVGVVFGYACHATTLDHRRWSGDYPGYAMQTLEAYNPGAVALFVAGCGADQNPIPRRSVELAKKYGAELADSVTAVLGEPMRVLPASAAAAYKEIDLPLAEVPTREALLKDAEDKNKYVAARAKMLLEKLNTGTPIPAAYPYPIQTWRLGDDLTIPFLGGEVVVDYSWRLKKEVGPTAWPVAYANDVMAYIPSARVLKEGGYEGGGAMVYYGLPAVWGPKVEELVVAEAVRQATAVKGK